MKSSVTEVAAGLYRISTFHPDFGIQFNQFLLDDDQPFLMHTALKKMFPITLEGVSSVLDPAKVRWIGFSHFESDECGALNEWLNPIHRTFAGSRTEETPSSVIGNIFFSAVCIRKGSSSSTRN